MYKGYSISWLWKPIVTNKQAQKKQQKMQNIQFDLYTLQNMLIIIYPWIVILPMLFEMALPLHINFFLGTLLLITWIACTNSLREPLDSNCCNFHKSVDTFMFLDKWSFLQLKIPLHLH